MVIKDMKRLMTTRLHLAKASASKRVLQLPHNDITQLERDLMEVRRILLKLSMHRQILNTALQKSIQSTLLHHVSRNLFTVKKLNYIEDSVEQQMKLMMETSKLIRSQKEEINLQSTEILRLEEKLLGRRIAQHERLSQLAESSTSLEKSNKVKSVQKTINSINKLSSLLTILAMKFLGDSDGVNAVDEKLQILKLATKWRTPRSIKYYESKF